MTLHPAIVKTAAVKVVAFRRLFLSICPECGEVPVAPVSAEFIAHGHIGHLWACDACGLEFRTSVEFAPRDDEPVRQEPTVRM